MEKKRKKGHFYSVAQYGFILSIVKNLFLFVIHVDIHIHIAAIFEREIKIKAKKAFFYSISPYKLLLKLVENLFLLCLFIDAHLGLLLGKFQVIAAIFEWEIKKKGQKSSFLQYFTV